MSFVSYAQNMEDVMLWRALRHVPQGFYIDVGASHPGADSVTRAFYDQGWNGINIEPAPGVFAELAAERPRDINLNIAIAEQPGQCAFYSIADGEGLSTLDPVIAAAHRQAGYACQWLEVEARTLTAVCASHVPGPIHFLKVDVEGAEAAVLRSADFGRWRPWIVLLEATFPNTQTPSWQEWEPLLLQARYRFAYFDGLNRFYVAEERAELLDAFAAPPSVFDDFRLAREVAAHAAAAAHAARAAELEIAGGEWQARFAASLAERDLEQAAAAAWQQERAEQGRALETARCTLEATQQLVEERRLRAESAEALVLTSRHMIELAERRAADAASLAAAAQQEIAAMHVEAARLAAANETLNRSLARHVQALAEAVETRREAEAATLQARVQAAADVMQAQVQAEAQRTAIRRSLSAELAAEQQRNAEFEARQRRRDAEYETSLAQQRQRQHRLEIRLSDLRRSTSWRLTRPIRLAKRLLTNKWD